MFNQVFLTSTLIYLLPPILMVVLTLLLTPRVNRTVNIVISFLYLISIIVSCIGETWIYYLLGGFARAAWRWPPPTVEAGWKRIGSAVADGVAADAPEVK